MYVELFLMAAICNLFSNFMSDYKFGGGLMIFLLASVVMIIYKFCLSGGYEEILTKPMNQLTNFKDYEMYMKELSIILANKRIFLIILIQI